MSRSAQLPAGELRVHRNRRQTGDGTVRIPVRGRGRARWSTLGPGLWPCPPRLRRATSGTASSARRRTESSPAGSAQMVEQRGYSSLDGSLAILSQNVWSARTISKSMPNPSGFVT